MIICYQTCIVHHYHIYHATILNLQLKHSLSTMIQRYSQELTMIHQFACHPTVFGGHSPWRRCGMITRYQQLSIHQGYQFHSWTTSSGLWRFIGHHCPPSGVIPLIINHHSIIINHQYEPTIIINYHHQPSFLSLSSSVIIIINHRPSLTTITQKNGSRGRGAPVHPKQLIQLQGHLQLAVGNGLARLIPARRGDLREAANFAGPRYGWCHEKSWWSMLNWE